MCIQVLIGLIGGSIAILHIVFIGVKWVFRHFYAVKITPREPARLEYDDEKKVYMIIAPRVEMKVRRAIVSNKKIIRLKDTKEYFDSLETAYGKTEIFEAGKIIKDDMQFITEFRKDEDIKRHSLSGEDVKARIEIESCKSAYFSILPVQPIITEINFKRVIGKVPPPLADGEDKRIKHD